MECRALSSDFYANPMILCSTFHGFRCSHEQSEGDGIPIPKVYEVNNNQNRRTAMQAGCG